MNFARKWKDRFVSWVGATPSQVVSRIAFLLTATSIVFLSAVYRLISDLSPIGEYLTIWPSFFWCFGLLPLSLLAWDRTHRKYVLILWCGIGLFLLATEDWTSVVRMGKDNATEKFGEVRRNFIEDGSDIPLRLVSWNINNGSGGMSHYLDRLASLDPDICFLQETPDDADATARALSESALHSFYWLDSGDTAFLSRYPLEAQSTTLIGPWSPPQVVSIQLPLERDLIAINVRLMLPSLILNPISSRNRKTLRRDQSLRIMQFVRLGEKVQAIASDRKESAIIVAGDFNTPGRMMSLRPLRTLLVDAWTEKGFGWGGTATNQFPVSRIDQCWVSSKFQIVSAHVEHGGSSDHRLLVTDVVLMR